jgi:hypothetical protein
MKEYCGSKVITPILLNLGATWSGAVNIAYSHYFIRGKTPLVPTVYEARCAPEPVSIFWRR